MRTFNYLYDSLDGFRRFAALNGMDNQKKVLIRIHTAKHIKSDITQLVFDILSVFPNAQIAGTSAMAVMSGGKFYYNKCLVSILDFEESDFEVKCVSYIGKSAKELARMVDTQCCQDDTRLMFAFFPNEYESCAEFIDCFDEIHKGVNMLGGIVSANNYLSSETFVFTNIGVCPQSVLIACVNNENLKVHCDAIKGYGPIGDVFTITKAKGGFIDEIDGENAVDWFCEQLGLESLAEPQGIGDIDPLLYFALTLEDKDKVVRVTRYNAAANKLELYNDKLSDGEKFRIGYLSPHNTIVEIRDICNRMQLKPIECLFSYSSIFRNILLSSSAKWELTPFSQTNIAGTYLNGEIGNFNGKNRLHNCTNVIVGIAEGERSITIDNDALVHLPDIEDDAKELLNFVLKAQSEAMRRKNQDLFDRVMYQQSLNEKTIFTDSVTGLDNLTRYMYDNEKKAFDKICMVAIEKSFALRTHFGEETFMMIVNDNINNIRLWLDDERYHFYALDDYSFLIAPDNEVDADEFLEKMKEVYKLFGIFDVQGKRSLCLNRFSLVINETDVLEKVRIAYDSVEDASSRFVVYNSDYIDDVNIEDSIFWIEVINDAINNDRVEPFFQPIHNNRTDKIDKFESLMRLRGKNREIYSPCQFMDIAKEYKLYLQLSERMISKVFEVFKERKETVSINLTAYDINSREMREMILSYLGSVDTPDRFIFEIVESEDFRDYDALIDFVREIKNLGGKIAIDDFGAGYSNLVKIAKLTPDFIKIDGEIIKNILKDEFCDTIAQTVVFLARKINVDLIAEFVENQDLQKAVEELNILFSQGYYFSRPVSLSGLKELWSQNS